MTGCHTYSTVEGYNKTQRTLHESYVALANIIRKV